MQNASVLLPRAEYEFGGQSVQFEDAFCAENVPSSQSIHGAEPACCLYEPDGHALHSTLSGSPVRLTETFVNPAAQEQSDSNLLPILEVVSVGHCLQEDSAIAPVLPGGVMNLAMPHNVHSSDPLVGLYLPLSQAEQLPPGPVYPILHKQSPRAPLPDAANEFAGQSLQTAAVEAAEVTENVPPLHLEHEAEPRVDL